MSVDPSRAPDDAAPGVVNLTRSRQIPGAGPYEALRPLAWPRLCEQDFSPESRRTLMSEKPNSNNTTRREVLKKAVFVAPSIITLTAKPALASAGSQDHGIRARGHMLIMKTTAPAS
jgi:hypothetical protein